MINIHSKKAFHATMNSGTKPTPWMADFASLGDAAIAAERQFTTDGYLIEIQPDNIMLDGYGRVYRD